MSYHWKKPAGRKLTRREFLSRVTFGTAGAAFAFAASPALARIVAGEREEGPGVIDPPPGVAFADPAELKNDSTLPGIVEVDLEARPAWVDIDGTPANLMTYNGSFPGPTIRAKSGDRLKIHLKNSLPQMGKNVLNSERSVTNLHVHGLHVSPAGRGDNPAVLLVPGGSFPYEYDLSRQDPGTINYYHPQVQGSAAEQCWSGMAGALLIEDEVPALAAFETHLLFIKDITLSGSAPEPYTSLAEYMSGKEGGTVTVNGQVNPVLAVRPGQVQRWQIVNACNARFLKLSLEEHRLQIIGSEGGLLDRPYPLSSILLAPGERLDVLVKANGSMRNYRLLSLSCSRTGGNLSRQTTLLTLNCSGDPVNDRIPPVIDPSAVRVDPGIEKTERLILTMGQGKGFVNGVAFTAETRHTLHSRVGTHEVWEIVNQSAMDHPFHQQVNDCQVLSLNGGDPSYADFLTSTPAWKDTVIVPRGGSVRILVPVADYPGVSRFQCGIPEHGDIGMAGVWDLMDRATTV